MQGFIGAKIGQWDASFEVTCSTSKPIKGAPIWKGDSSSLSTSL